VLQGIKILKLYCWEDSYQARVEAMRAREVLIIRRMNFLESLLVRETIRPPHTHTPHTPTPLRFPFTIPPLRNSHPHTLTYMHKMHTATTLPHIPVPPHTHPFESPAQACVCPSPSPPHVHQCPPPQPGQAPGCTTPHAAHFTRFPCLLCALNPVVSAPPPPPQVTMFLMLPVLMSLVTFAVFSYRGNLLTADVVFRTVALFNALRFPLIDLPGGQECVVWDVWVVWDVLGVLSVFGKCDARCVARSVAFAGVLACEGWDLPFVGVFEGAYDFGPWHDTMLHPLSGAVLGEPPCPSAHAACLAAGPQP
jgi:hypothetical protein